MALPNLKTSQIQSAGSMPTVANPTPASTAAPAMPDQISCRLHINRAVQRIEPPNVRAIVDTVFQDLLRLLECLSLIERHLRKVEAAEETFALFQIINEDAEDLVDFIREDALNCAAIKGDLAETLDGITFAVTHDLGRVFDSAPEEEFSETAAPVVIGKLYRAHDVLTNCLQQSTITLAILFDPDLIGTKLFNNSDMRYRQSLRLCEDLTALIQLIEATEKEKTVEALSGLSIGIDRFRQEALECLNYSDWPQFESFCEGIAQSPAGSFQFESTLHQFRCYLETLLGQVRMRAVLANVLPVQFGDSDMSALAASFDDEMAGATQSDKSGNDSGDDEPTWRNLALAG